MRNYGTTPYRRVWMENLAYHASQHMVYDVCVLAKSLQSYPTLCNTMDCSLPGSFVHGTLQAGILAWIAMPSSRGSSRPKDRTCISCLLHWQAGSLPLRPPQKPMMYGTAQIFPCLLLSQTYLSFPHFRMLPPTFPPCPANTWLSLSQRRPRLTSHSKCHQHATYCLFIAQLLLVAVTATLPFFGNGNPTVSQAQLNDSIRTWWDSVVVSEISMDVAFSDSTLKRTLSILLQ